MTKDLEYLSGKAIAPSEHAADRGQQIITPDGRADFDPTARDYTGCRTGDEPDVCFEFSPDRFAGHSA